jgi:hypothetical protein
VRVHYDEGIAIHIGPEPCGGTREGIGEASAGDRAGQPLSRESSVIPDADAFPTAEGNTDEGVSASPWTVRRGPRPWHVRTLLDREPGDRVSRTQARRVCGAVWKMKDRPFEVGFRERASNHPKRHRSKALVVSVGGKGRRYLSGVGHGDERERTTDDVSKHFLATSKPGAGPSPGTRLGGAR